LVTQEDAMTDQPTNLPARLGHEVEAQRPSPTGALLALRQALAPLEDEARAIAVTGDYETLARGYAELTALKRDLTTILGIVGDLTVETIPVQVSAKGKEYRDPVHIEGVGTFEVTRRAPTRRWESDELLHKLVRDNIVDRSTGELPDETALAAVDRVVSAIQAAAPFTPSMGWRVTALREQGVDVDDYCSTNRPEGLSLKFTGGEK
jgi:hypothetical protein